jgi:hypothetical protein
MVIDRHLGLLLSVVLVAGTVPASSSARPAKSQSDTPQRTLWTEVGEASLPKAGGERLIVPRAYRVFSLDQVALDEVLAQAPLELSAAAKEENVVLTLPMPDGFLARFRVEESPIMEPGLAAQFPSIRTFIAQGLDDPTATVRFDVTPHGFHAIVLSAGRTVYIDPYRRGDTSTYITYDTRDFRKEGAQFECLVEGGDAADVISKDAPIVTRSGEVVRSYRAAVAATGEYTSFHGGTATLGLAAVVTSMNRVNAIYEREVAIRMVLVANNASIVYTNAATDPYTNNNGPVMLGQNQTNLNAVIGAANYDIGHVFSTGGGGVASLGCVCANGAKARGVTGSSQPVGDPFDVDYVAHEMGHQFGGNHTFNGRSGSCFNNRAASAAYEPGSGSTIMGYAGICGAQNLQPHSDPYLHGKSFDEIIAYTNSGNGNNCPSQFATGNLPPTVDAGPSYTIPQSTPFALTATGSDPNGDAVTYCWEQFDLGNISPPDTDNGNRPIFRSFNPTTSPTRTFPRLSDVLANAATLGESLPVTNRTMTFRVTARDNRAGGSGVAFDSTQVAVTTSAGPFSVTAPNVPVTWGGNSAQTVTWNVANTSAAPVACANVRISISADGGLTFPYVVAASTPNDGSEAIVVPNVNTTAARVKVEAVGNIFFDLSNANLTIQAVAAATDSVGIHLPSGSVFLRNTNSPGPADYSFGYGPAGSGWTPLAGDWDVNGTDTIGLYDPASSTFFLKNSNAPGGADLVYGFGPDAAGWRPIAGDWDGNGTDTVGLFNPATSTFFLRNAHAPGAADVVVGFGPAGAGWVPIVGDWDGNGTDTVGLYNPASGAFFLKNSNAPGAADVVFTYGAPNLRPVAGDWNGDNADSIGVYNPATRTFFLKNSNAPGPADAMFAFGPVGATPLAGDWNGL